MNVGEEDEYR